MLIQAVSAVLPYSGRKARELIPSKLLRVVVIVPPLRVDPDVVELLAVQ